jgi:hypothetical protein
VSLRALGHELELDDEALTEIVEELVDVQGVAERDGQVLQLIGARATPDGSATSPIASDAPATPGSCVIGSCMMNDRERTRAYCEEAIPIAERCGFRTLDPEVRGLWGWTLGTEEAGLQAARGSIELAAESGVAFAYILHICLATTLLDAGRAGAEVCDRFTEGFESAPLRDARTLLQVLA